MYPTATNNSGTRTHRSSLRGKIMQFQNKYNRQKSKPEPPSGRSRVETAGYIPAKIKIESFFNAGARLIQSRKEQFDFPPGSEPTDYYDPTRRKDLDRVDIDIMQNALQARIDERIATQNAKDESKPSEDKQKPSEGLKTGDTPE